MIGESMAVFEENETWWWTWLDNPDAQTGNGNLEPMGLGRGTVTFKSKVVVDGMAWCLDRQGIWGYQGGERVFEIGGRLQAEFDRINWDEVAQIHAAYDDKRIYFFVPLDADTEIKYAFVLDRKSLQTRQGARWWLYYIPQGARDSTHYVLGPSSTAIDFNMVGKRVVHIITTEGYEQVFSEGVYSDGVHPEITHEGTLTGATTTVMTDGTGTFVVGNANLEGVYAWIDDPRSPDPVPVASSTSTTFTLKNALGYTPAVGTAYKLGKITSFWRSGQLDLGGPEVMKHFSQVAVVLSPKPEEGEIVITTRHGRLGEFIAGKSEANRTGWELVQYARGAKLKSGGRWGTTGNREGYTEVPIFGRDARYVEIEFFNEDYLPFELIGYYIQAVNFVVE